MHDSKRQSQERFGQFAAEYVTSTTHAKGAELPKLVDIAAPQSHWHMLDIATGGGHTALTFAPHVANVIATDITPAMLQKAEAFIREQGVENVTFQLADAENLPFEDAAFDLVTCRIAPHHFPNAAQFVRDCARVVKSGGVVLIQDQVLPEDAAAAQSVDDFERLRDPSHHQAFSRIIWERMFTDAGLTITHTEQIAKRHNLAHWAQMQACTEDTLAELQRRLQHASSAVSAWMQPQDLGTPEASFVNRHIIIKGIL